MLCEPSCTERVAWTGGAARNINSGTAAGCNVNMTCVLCAGMDGLRTCSTIGGSTIWSKVGICGDNNIDSEFRDGTLRPKTNQVEALGLRAGGRGFDIRRWQACHMEDGAQ